MEVVVSVDVGVVVLGYPAKHLHAHHAVDEEDEGDEQANPGQGLEGLEEGPEEGSDALVLVEQLDEPSDTEQPEETNRGRLIVGLERKNESELKKKAYIYVRHGKVDKGSDNNEEVEGIPRIFEIILKQRRRVIICSTTASKLP